jgi:hypothetical protein
MGGLFFLLSLRFAATRYWLPFVGPYWLWMHEDKWLKYWTLIMAIVSIHLAWDDAQLAKSQHHLARKVVQICKEQYGDEAGYFAGHWGWQYALEEVGWSSVENDSTIPNNVCFSYSEASWPQEIDNICFEDVVRFEFEYDRFGLPIRVHTAEGQANYHTQTQISQHLQSIYYLFLEARKPLNKKSKHCSVLLNHSQQKTTPLLPKHTANPNDLQSIPPHPRIALYKSEQPCVPNDAGSSLAEHHPKPNVSIQ